MGVAPVFAIASVVMSEGNYHRNSRLHITIAITVVDRHDHAAAQARDRDYCNKGKQNFFHVDLQ